MLCDLCQPSLIPFEKREVLAASILDIGKVSLRAASKYAEKDTDGKKASEAIEWIQSAFAIVEKLENSVTPGLKDLKVDHEHRFITSYLIKKYFQSIRFYEV